MEDEVLTPEAENDVADEAIEEEAEEETEDGE